MAGRPSERPAMSSERMTTFAPLTGAEPMFCIVSCAKICPVMESRSSAPDAMRTGDPSRYRFSGSVKMG